MVATNTIKRGAWKRRRMTVASMMIPVPAPTATPISAATGQGRPWGTKRPGTLGSGSVRKAQQAKVARVAICAWAKLMTREPL